MTTSLHPTQLPQSRSRVGEVQMQFDASTRVGRSLTSHLHLQFEFQFCPPGGTSQTLSNLSFERFGFVMWAYEG